MRKMDPKIINAIAEAAAREGGLESINMVGTKRRWHDCVMRSRRSGKSALLYNDRTNVFTRAVSIR